MECRLCSECWLLADIVPYGRQGEECLRSAKLREEPWNVKCTGRCMRRPRNWAERWPAPPRGVVVLTPDEQSFDAGIALYMRAARFRRACTRKLRRFGLSFPLWWVLMVTDRLVRETNDAVSQLDVCRRTQLDKSSVSYLMGRLSELALVDRGPDEWCLAWRIFVTTKGKQLLGEVRAAMGEVARAT